MPEVAETTRQCPGCDTALEPTQTLCNSCRAQIETEVLAVKADYLKPVRTEQEPQEATLQPAGVQAVEMDMKPAAEVQDEYDLIPLSPIDDKPTPKPAAAVPVAAAPTATSPVISRAPSPTAPPLVEKGSQLAPTSRWKHVLVAVGALVLAGVAAWAIWAYVVPAHGVEESTTQPAAARLPAGR